MKPCHAASVRAGRSHHAAGFSLIEIAIGLTVIALLAMPVIEGYNQQVAQNKKDNTTTNLGLVSAALQNYYSGFNKLPCPADPSLKESDANYGHADCAVSVVPGNANILAGTVPFADLHIPASVAIDAWQTKIGYTVARADQTAPLNLMNKPVTLKGNDKDGNPVADINLHYILVSYGEDGAGGYTISGQLRSTCPAAGIRETANCNKSGIFYNNSFARSTSAGSNNYLDDLIFYNESLSPGIWTYVPPGQSGSATAYNNIWTQDYIGIGTSPSTFLDVAGNVKIESGTSNTASDKICDAGGGNCFPATIIAGSGMGAGPSAPTATGCVYSNNIQDVPTAMTGVKKADAVCQVQTGLTVTCATCGASLTCPSGQFVQGIDAGGRVTCAAP